MNTLNSKPSKYVLESLEIGESVLNDNAQIMNQSYTIHATHQQAAGSMSFTGELVDLSRHNSYETLAGWSMGYLGVVDSQSLGQAGAVSMNYQNGGQNGGFLPGDPGDLSSIETTSFQQQAGSSCYEQYADDNGNGQTGSGGSFSVIKFMFFLGVAIVVTTSILLIIHKVDIQTSIYNNNRCVQSTCNNNIQPDFNLIQINNYLTK